MKSSVIVDFLVELMKRFALKSPKFFQVLQNIAIAATLITGIPEFIDLLNSMGASIVLPEIWLKAQSKVIMWCGIIMWMMAKLPVINSERPTTGDGKPVSKFKALPYTEKKQ